MESEDPYLDSSGVLQMDLGTYFGNGGWRKNHVLKRDTVSNKKIAELKKKLVVRDVGAIGGLDEGLYPFSLD